MQDFALQKYNLSNKHLNNFHTVNQPINIIVIGAGGTGSWFFPKLCRFIEYVCEMGEAFDDYGDTINLYLCDGDIVEEKNIGRQNFIESDIGLKKSDVLTERYGSAYIRNTDPHKKVNVYSISNYLEKIEDLKFMELENGTYSFDLAKTSLDKTRFALPNGRTNFNIVFDCVDNNSTRRMFREFALRTAGSVLLFSSGNKLFSGEVMVTHYPSMDMRLLDFDYVINDNFSDKRAYSKLSLRYIEIAKKYEILAKALYAGNLHLSLLCRIAIFCEVLTKEQAMDLYDNPGENPVRKITKRYFETIDDSDLPETWRVYHKALFLMCVDCESDDTNPNVSLTMLEHTDAKILLELEATSDHGAWIHNTKSIYDLFSREIAIEKFKELSDEGTLLVFSLVLDRLKKQLGSIDNHNNTAKICSNIFHIVVDKPTVLQFLSYPLVDVLRRLRESDEALKLSQVLFDVGMNHIVDNMRHAKKGHATYQFINNSTLVYKGKDYTLEEVKEFLVGDLTAENIVENEFLVSIDDTLSFILSVRGHIPLWKDNFSYIVDGILPDKFDIYEDAWDDKDAFSGNLGCGEASVSHPQAIFVNELAAQTLMQMFSDWYHGNLSYHRVFFDIHNQTNKVPITFDTFKFKPFLPPLEHFSSVSNDSK